MLLQSKHMTCHQVELIEFNLIEFNKQSEKRTPKIHEMKNFLGNSKLKMKNNFSWIHSLWKSKGVIILQSCTISGKGKENV